MCPAFGFILERIFVLSPCQRILIPKLTTAISSFFHHHLSFVLKSEHRASEKISIFISNAIDSPMAEEDSPPTLTTTAAAELPDLRIHINGVHTFFLNQNLAAYYSQNLRKLIKLERKRRRRSRYASSSYASSSGRIEGDDIIVVEIEDFPGGAAGFELVARYIHSCGRILPDITVSNLTLLHCAAASLSIPSLLHRTDGFMDGGGIFYCSWKEILFCLNSCGRDDFLPAAESSGLLDRLVCSLLAKIAQNSTEVIGCSNLASFNLNNSNSSTTSVSEEDELLMSQLNPRFFRVSESTTPDRFGTGNNNNNKLSSTNLMLVVNSNSNSSNNKAWWFDDLATLPPKIIERIIKSLGAYGAENSSLLLTRFLLHYLKTASQKYNINNAGSGESYCYGGLADTAVYGVILMGKTAFSSCRALFGVLRVVSGFGRQLSKECRAGLEKLIGSVLDQVKLDDLLVSGDIEGGGGCGAAYDVNLVVRLIRVFVHTEGVTIQRLKRVGWLIDQYLCEISPDQNLKVSKFIGVAQSLPDLARDCFDGVYRAIDIYLESHPSLSVGERSRLCRCLNYEKLTLEACKDLAKNPKIPPRVAVQALASQQAHITPTLMADDDEDVDHFDAGEDFYEDDKLRHRHHAHALMLYNTTNNNNNNNNNNNSNNNNDDKSRRFSEDSEDLRMNIEKMQWRVVELEKMCREMKGQMMVMSSTTTKKAPSQAVNETSTPSSTYSASPSSSTKLQYYSPRLC